MQLSCIQDDGQGRLRTPNTTLTVLGGYMQPSLADWTRLHTSSSYLPRRSISVCLDAAMTPVC